MDKRGLLLLFLVVIPFAYAALSQDNVIMSTGDNITVGGRVIKFVSISGNDKYFSVDGIPVLVNFNNSKILNGVKIFVDEDYGSIVKVDIDVNYECGDKTCSEDEFCCSDCGCANGTSCTENRCILSSLNKCAIDLDCNDNNNLTKDICSGFPRSCYHEISNKTNEIITTNETTTQTNITCKQNECLLDGKCYPENTTLNGQYCSSTQFVAKKQEGSSCSSGIECDSNTCQSLRCVKVSVKDKIIIPQEEIKANLMNYGLVLILFIILVLTFLHYKKISKTV